MEIELTGNTEVSEELYNDTLSRLRILKCELIENDNIYSLRNMYDNIIMETEQLNMIVIAVNVIYHYFDKEKRVEH